LDQSPLYNAINFELRGVSLEGGVDPGNWTVLKQRIDSFLCPSDPGGWGASSGWNNYRANMGICEFCSEANAGSFVFGRLGDLASFRDGTSNTIVFSEKLVGSPSVGAYSSVRDWIRYTDNPVPTTGEQWVAVCSGLVNADHADFNAGHSWLFPGGVYTWFFVSVPPNSRIPDCGVLHTGGTGVFAARSFHPSSVSAAMADGAVRAFSSSVDSGVWRGLGTRDRGEISSGF
jgi:hypothetical protein